MSFSSSFFIENRNRLCQALPGHLICIPAHNLLQYSADLHYPFRQDSNFWYLTGINDPDATLLLDTNSGEATLLYPEQNDYQKEWDGKNDQVSVKVSSGVEQIGSETDLKKIVQSAIDNGLKIGYLKPSKKRIEPYGFYANPARQLFTTKLKRYAKSVELHDVRIAIARLRQVKQPIEIKAIRAAIRVTAMTLANVKNNLTTYENEKDIERAITAGFYSNGGDGHSFDPIIASGGNAATIHYVDNDSRLIAKDLLLVDVGARLNGYTSDISRTWSLNGTPSKRQQEVVAACLDIQEAGIAMLKPGAYLKDVQAKLSDYAKDAFKKLECSMQDKPFPHGFSHYMGIDVHDAGDYTEPLVPGVVLTMEPGIYLSDEGIGVRIEDDILITGDGAENLSEMIPKLL